MVGISQVRRQLYFVHSHSVAESFRPQRAPQTRLEGLDCALIFLFMLGPLYQLHHLYLRQSTVPVRAVRHCRNGSSVAGRRDLIRTWLLILPVFLASSRSIWSPILWATNIEFLPRRTNGLIQLSYSIIIGYALFLTVTQGTRRQIGRLFLGFALVILVGCLLETYAGLRPLSDAVRSVLYSRGLYENDLRDVSVL